MNGRSGKVPDVCYSWWVGTTISIIDEYFNTNLLQDPNQTESSLTIHDLVIQWILSCQNLSGGFSREPSQLHEQSEITIYVTIESRLMISPSKN